MNVSLTVLQVRKEVEEAGKDIIWSGITSKSGLMHSFNQPNIYSDEFAFLGCALVIKLVVAFWWSFWKADHYMESTAEEKSLSFRLESYFRGDERSCNWASDSLIGVVLEQISSFKTERGVPQPVVMKRWSRSKKKKWETRWLAT